MVMRNVNIGIEGALNNLREEQIALEARLEAEQDLEEREKLQNKITQITEEIETLERTPQATGSALLYGLETNIHEIEEKLKSEKDFKKRGELETQRLSCIKAYQERQKPIEKEQDLEDAVSQIKYDSYLIQKLSDESIDQVDLDYLMRSDLLPFFDHQLQGGISIAYNQMVTNDFVKSTVRPPVEAVGEEVDKEWTKFKGDIERKIGELKEERGKLEGKSFARGRIKDIDDQIQRYEAQMSQGPSRANWQHRKHTLKEIGQTKNVAESVNPEVLHKLQTLIQQAQFMRAEKIREYLRGQYEDLEAHFSQIKSEGIFGEKAVKKIEAELAEGRFLLIDDVNPIYNPEVLGKLAGNFKAAKKQLSISADEIREVRQHRPEIEAQVKADVTDMTEKIKGITPDVIDQARVRLREIEGRRLGDKLEKSANFKKANAILSELEAPDSDLKTKMAEFSKLLETPEKLSPEELIMIQQEVALLKPKLSILSKEKIQEMLDEDNETAMLAHRTIVELDRVTSMKEIKKVLSRNLSAEHLEFVPSGEFESKYRKYTEEGHMVVYQRGDEWRIIIDESILTDESKFDEIKKQLTHELLHLEFDKGKRVQEEVKKVMIKDQPEQWRKIRAAFIDMAKESGKQPPHGDTWEDDDILSELYAMQNEIGVNWSAGHSPKERLNNLLIGAGFGSVFDDIQKTIRGYEDGTKEADEIIRGYEAGMDSGGDTSEGPTSAGVESAKGSGYETNKVKIDALQKTINELKHSEYIDVTDNGASLLRVMESYNNGTRDLNEKLRRDPNSDVLAQAVEDRISKVDGDLKKVQDEMSKAGNEIENRRINPLQKLWNNTTFLSIADFVRLGTDVYEFFQRRHKRKEADHAARLGGALFHGTDLGREARARKQKAEAEEVQEWQSRYESLDAWQLYDELESLSKSIVPSKDQLKAILRILAQKGRIDWRNVHLWNALNKLQGATHLDPEDDVLMHNPILLRQKLHTALGKIWDYDEFTTLERQNDSSYDSEKQKYNHSNDRMQDQLTGRLDYLLAQYRGGEKVDPLMYESILEYSILNGKSYAENVMFHLLIGMAEGLLTVDRGLALGKHLNEWPTIDWFTSLSPPPSKEDFRQMCLKNFKEDYLNGTISQKNTYKSGVARGYTGKGLQFKNFYWTVIQNDSKVVQRVRKSVSERKWDHDWSRAIACMGDAETAKRFLAGRSGQQETRSTAVEGSYVGVVQWLEENSLTGEATRKDYARIAGYIAMSEGILDGTAYNRGDQDISTRETESMNNSIPREAVFGRHEDLTLQGHRTKSTGFLDLIEDTRDGKPSFFALLRKKVAKSEEDKKALGEQARQLLLSRYPSLADKIGPSKYETIDINQIYDNIDLIILTMFSEEYMSDARFKAIQLALQPPRG